MTWSVLTCAQCGDGIHRSEFDPSDPHDRPPSDGEDVFCGYRCYAEWRLAGAGGRPPAEVLDRVVDAVDAGADVPLMRLVGYPESVVATYRDGPRCGVGCRRMVIGTIADYGIDLQGRWYVIEDAVCTEWKFRPEAVDEIELIDA